MWTVQRDSVDPRNPEMGARNEDLLEKDGEVLWTRTVRQEQERRWKERKTRGCRITRITGKWSARCRKRDKRRELNSCSWTGDPLHWEQGIPPPDPHMCDV